MRVEWRWGQWSLEVMPVLGGPSPPGFGGKPGVGWPVGETCQAHTLLAAAHSP